MAGISSDIRADRRVKKTQAALSAAIFRLIGNHDWEEISVSRICAEANVARSTFYLHFTSPTALLDDMIAKVVGALANQASEPLPVLEWLVDHITSNRVIFHRTVVTARSSHVIDRFKAGVIQALVSEHANNGAAVSPNRLAMLIGGTFEAIQYWARTWNLATLAQLKSDIRHLEAALIERNLPERRRGYDE